VHRGRLLALAGQEDAHLVVGQRAQVRHVPVEERDGAVDRTAHHHLGLAVEQDLLWRHQLHRERLGHL
jgi:hypothetical protein